MSDAVVARQQGDDYQARFFWYKACDLYVRDSTAVKIKWEMSDAPGFDDVAIFYQPAIRDTVTGNPVEGEYFQVKFHVDHSRGFTCDALMEPEFIGNKTESILQRLHKNFNIDPVVFGKSLYYLVNTWGLDHSDSLASFIDNSGAVKLNRLFDGTTDASAMGQVRKKWRTHLGVTDAELRTLLAQLRLLYNARGIDGVTEDLNYRLQSVGFKPVSKIQRTCAYSGLIQKLHAENKKSFTKEQLLEILKQEQLLLETDEPEDTLNKIGIRSFRRGAETLSFETNDYLCLLHHFQGRFVLDEPLWESSILPSLTAFAEKTISFGKPVQIHLDTHQSVAFAFGYNLDSKCGVATSVIQKTKSGRVVFACDPTSDDYQQHKADENWQIDEIKLDETGGDIVLAVSVTHDITADVSNYVVGNIPGVQRLIAATILDKPSGYAIRNGNHISLAAEELVAKLRRMVTATERKGCIHLFMAAPNALIFSLGQNFRSFGKIRLYEYDFENTRSGSYHLSISLNL